MRKIILIIFISVLSLIPVSIKAQSASEFLPCNQYDPSVFDACGTNVNDQVTNLIKVAISAVFALIVLYGIFLIIKAALTIIRSNGDPGQVQSGADILRGVYIGIGIIFVGLIGLIIVIAFFGAEGILSTNVNTPGNTVIPLITN